MQLLPPDSARLLLGALSTADSLSSGGLAPASILEKEFYSPGRAPASAARTPTGPRRRQRVRSAPAQASLRLRGPRPRAPRPCAEALTAGGRCLHACSSPTAQVSPALAAPLPSHARLRCLRAEPGRRPSAAASGVAGAPAQGVWARPVGARAAGPPRARGRRGELWRSRPPHTVCRTPVAEAGHGLAPRPRACAAAGVRVRKPAASRPVPREPLKVRGGRPPGGGPSKGVRPRRLGGGEAGNDPRPGAELAPPCFRPGRGRGRPTGPPELWELGVRTGRNLCPNSGRIRA